MCAGPVSLAIINFALSIREINFLIFIGSPSSKTTFALNSLASLTSSYPGAIKIEYLFLYSRLILVINSLK